MQAKRNAVKAEMTEKKQAAAELEQKKKSVTAAKKKAVAAAKKKAAAEKRKVTKAAKAVKKAAEDAEDDEPLLKVGMKVMGLWPADTEDDEDQWYNGTVLVIDCAKATVHIQYDDKDEDDAVSWDNVRILEDLDG